MLFILICINLCCNIAISYRMYLRGSPFFLLFLVLSGLVILPSMFEPVGDVVYYHPFAAPLVVTEDLLIRVHVIVLISTAIFGCFELLSRRRILGRLNNPFTSGALVVPVALLVTLAAAFIMYGGYSVLNVGFSDLRNGALGSTNLIVQYLVLLTSPLPALFVLSRKWSAAIFSFACILGTTLLLGGSRQALFASIVMVMVFCMKRTRLSFAILTLTVVVLMPVVDEVLALSKALRNMPSFWERIDFITNPELRSIALSGTSRESSLRYVLYSLFVDGGGPEGFGRFYYFARVLLFWLPNFLDVYGIKPDDFEYTVFYEVMGGREGSMHPTLYGIMFADMRFWFPVWAISLALCMRFAERMICRLPSASRMYMCGILLYVGIMWARGSIYGPILVSAVGFVLIRAIDIIASLECWRQAIDRRRTVSR